MLLAIDAVLDTVRAMLNLIGNCLATAVMARREGELNLPTAEEPTPPAAVTPQAVEVLEAE